RVDRFIIPHDLLHERGVDQLTEPVLAIMDVDDIAFRRGAGIGLKANSLGRDIPQLLEQVGDGPMVRRCDAIDRCSHGLLPESPIRSSPAHVSAGHYTWRSCRGRPGWGS